MRNRILFILLILTAFVACRRDSITAHQAPEAGSETTTTKPETADERQETIAESPQTADDKRHYMPGDTVPATVLAVVERVDSFFRAQEISDSVFAVMQGKTYPKDCPVRRSDLRYLTCLHTDVKGNTMVGELVVNQKIADKVLSIFRKLYEAHYPIERMRLADNYDGDDERTMTANNTSAFNFRYVSGTHSISKHGYGMAIDINPLYNPYIHTTKTGVKRIEPAAGKPYADRSKTFDYKLEAGDLCHRLFKEAGFRWGGDWRTMKDYQHFDMR